MDKNFQLVHSNMDLIFLIYGAAFFLLGVTILTQPKRGSSFQFADILWLLAVFGLIHGGSEWMDMWKIVHGTNLAVNILGILCLLSSYIFLFEFGRRLVRLTSIRSPLWQYRLAALLSWKIYLPIITSIFLAGLISEDSWLGLNVWSRYLLGFTGSLLIGIGFLCYYHSEEERLTNLQVKIYFIMASLAFVIYGISSGLIVPAAGYFPANKFNYDFFLNLTQLPVQLFRAAAAVLAAFSVAKILRIFRHEAESRLENSLAEVERLSHRNELILEAAGNGIIGIDSQGVCNFANLSALRIFGCEEQQLVDHSIYTILQSKNNCDDQDVDNRCRLAKAIREAKEDRGHSCSFLHDDKNTVDVEYVVTPLKERGEYVGTVVTLNDVTERRQLQRQLQQAQKMEVIGQLTGGIAHDFNNILSSIIGFTSLILQDLDDGNQSNLREYLGEVAHAGERARDLVSQMLAFGRTSSNKAIPLQLSPMIKEVTKMLRVTLPSSIRLSSQVDDDISVITIDPVHLQQVLMNLCINARDAIGSKGCLDILVHNAEVGYGVSQEDSKARVLKRVCDSCHKDIKEGDYVEISVRDTGNGINKEMLDRIFDPFFTTKDVGKGTGMGLSMVHGIVHQYGGHVIVDAEPGAGTTFSLLFPVGEQEFDYEPDVEINKTLINEESNNARLLVVDDDNAVAKFMGDLLKKHGYKVTTMTDSQAAYDLFSKDPAAFDMIITDQTMPGLTGVEIAHKVQALRPELPVIICSGYSNQIDAEKAEELGIRGFLFKPMEVDALLNMVADNLLF